jgi:hypothetical protein
VIYPSFRHLKAYLGKVSSLVALTEVAISELMRSAEASGDRDAYLRVAGERHAISVEASQAEYLRRRAAQSYLVVVNEAAEDFLYNFRREHAGLTKYKWGDRRHKQSSLGE